MTIINTNILKCHYLISIVVHTDGGRNGWIMSSIMSTSPYLVYKVWVEVSWPHCPEINIAMTKGGESDDSAAVLG